MREEETNSAQHLRITIHDGAPHLAPGPPPQVVPPGCCAALDDCGTIHQGAGQLQGDDGAFLPVLISGPWRALLLADGQPLRRGQAVLLPAALAQALIAAEQAVRLPAALAHNARPPATGPISPAALPAHAADQIPAPVLPHPQPASDLTALERTSPALARTLLACLDRQRPAFDLIGTDPADAAGCCPSPLVGEALGLVAAGILAAQPDPNAPAHRVRTRFAFAADDRGNDAPMRQAVALALAPRRPALRRGLILRRLLQGLLLGLVISTTVVTLGRLILRPAAIHPDGDLISGLDLPSGRFVLLALLQNQDRCEPCEMMAAVAQELVAGPLAPAAAAGRLHLVTIDLTLPQHRHLIGHYRLPLISALVAAQVVDRQVVTDIVLADTATLIQRPDRAQLAQVILEQVQAWLEVWP